VSLRETPSAADNVASLEGIAVADASVLLVADDSGEVLLANDRGLIDVARSYGVDCWWVTTLLLDCTKHGVLTPDEAADVLYDLVNQAMNLHTQVQNRLRELDDGTE
jgi:hypothetical protein